MPRIFITGSTDGLGRAAAGVVIGDGHNVVLHARARERAAALSDLAPHAAGVVIGDLASAAETREFAGSAAVAPSQIRGQPSAGGPGNPAYGLAQLRQDLERFVFLFGGCDGEPLFGPPRPT